jgi:hypothetical protein
MAKKQAAPTLSAEHKALAAQLGFPDLSQVDWSKVLQVLQFIIALLQSQPHQMTATAKAGCETHCEGCLTAARRPSTAPRACATRRRPERGGGRWTH